MFYFIVVCVVLFDCTMCTVCLIFFGFYFYLSGMVCLSFFLLLLRACLRACIFVTIVMIICTAAHFVREWISLLLLFVSVRPERNVFVQNSEIFLIDSFTLYTVQMYANKKIPNDKWIVSSSNSIDSVPCYWLYCFVCT